MNQRPIILPLVMTTLLCCSRAEPHGLPLDVFLNSHNELIVGSFYDVGPLELIGGVVVTTTLPAVAALSPGNGIPQDSELGVNVLQGLLFWDGTTVSTTSASMLVQAPGVDGFGNLVESPVANYDVTASSGFQSGILWGAYQNSPVGWHSHGNFSLLPSTASAGIYALVMQVVSPGRISSEPILLPFEYDPLDEFDPVAIAQGTAELAGHVVSFSVGDVSRDTAVDIGDFTLWADAFGETMAGAPQDVSGDGQVDIGDFTIWADHFGDPFNQSAGSVPTAVPEPSSALLLAVAGVSIAFWIVFQRRRRSVRA